MKTTIFLTAAGLLFALSGFAQAPKQFRYQGIARDSTGNPVANSTVSLRISIHQGSAGGTVVYRETHQPGTNQFGAFGVNIGAGTVLTGNFATIPWNRYSFFQEVEMDAAGGAAYLQMGISAYLSVPYALAADSAKYGVAPFIVTNFSGANDTAGVALAAIGNTPENAAPAVYIKNMGTGTSLYAEAGNGKHILGNARGFETNGDAQIGGKLHVDDTMSVNAPLSVNGNTSMNNLTLFGTLNGTIVNGSQGHFTGQITANGANINNDAHVFGDLQVDGQYGPINGNLINGTQGSFSGGVAAGHLAINGSGTISGDLSVAGVLSKGAGSFKIDHPLDPANKFLYHSFVESPDMKNIYDGTVTTDANGNATVVLPNYFEALNRDFRYQLTPIGQFAQAIIAEEISSNQFVIKTDKPNVKISWQVTGIRKDAFAEKHRIIPEVEKNETERGKYLYP